MQRCSAMLLVCGCLIPRPLQTGPTVSGRQHNGEAATTPRQCAASSTAHLCKLLLSQQPPDDLHLSLVQGEDTHLTRLQSMFAELLSLQQHSPHIHSFTTSSVISRMSVTHLPHLMQSRTFSITMIALCPTAIALLLSTLHIRIHIYCYQRHHVFKA